MPELTHATVFDAFRDSAERWARLPFLHILPETAQIYGVPAETLSYGAALVEVERLVAIYRRAGYGHGHRAGLLLENRPAFFLHWLALNALGVSAVPISAELRSAELEYLTGHSEMCLAVTLAQRTADLRAAADKAGRALVVATPEAIAGVGPAPLPPARSGAPGIDTECGLLYTSGTTGRPKGCVLTNEYYLFAGAQYNAIGGMCGVRPGSERLITPLPMVHMNAMACSTMAMILAGGCIVPVDRFHSGTWWRSVRESEATIIHYLGVMPSMLMGAEPSPGDRGHRVKFGFGAGVDPRLHAPFEARFGFPLLEAWGMTETGMGGAIIASCEPRHVGTACFGRPGANVEARVVDDRGSDVPAGVPGELLVRAAGPDRARGFFREYLKEPEATAEAWAGGWFHTGDVVTCDAAGYFRFVDRKKNVIRRSGENIAAVEVESVLRQHPLVSQVAVTATPDPVRGDEVLACVIPARPIPSDGMAAAAADLTTFCLQQLAYYKAPGYVAFVESLPLTATQKLQRAELKALARGLPGTPGCVDTRHMKRRQG